MDGNIFAYKIKVTAESDGLVSSPLGFEEVAEKFRENLVENVGEENFEILEFREATDEERELLAASLERQAEPQKLLN